MTRTMVLVLFAAAWALSGCSGDDGGEADPAATVTVTATATAAPADLTQACGVWKTAVNEQGSREDLVAAADQVAAEAAALEDASPERRVFVIMAGAMYRTATAEGGQAMLDARAAARDAAELVDEVCP